jgi:DNA-binding transcriptional ArsR family regulator
VITVRLAPAAMDEVSLAYSPLLECVLSLRVALQPRRHPAHRRWARQLRRLPASLQEAIERHAFVFGDNAPVFVAASSGGFEPFADELALLRTMAPSLVRYQFTWALHQGTLTPAELERPSVRRQLRKTAAEELPAGRGEVELALEQPEAFLEAFADLIDNYFEDAFGKEWERIQPLLAKSAAEAEHRIANDGLFDALPSLSPRLRGDAHQSQILIDKAIDRTWKLDLDDRFVLAPSVYAWPNLIVFLEDGPWPKGISYPAPFLADHAVEPPPPDELVRLLRAVGDDTRLRVLRLIAEKPRSTQELAPLVAISEASLSRHLRKLLEVGILSRRRDGRFVLYALQREPLAELAPSVLRYLERDA